MGFTRKKKLSKHQQIDRVYTNITNPVSFTSVANLRENVDSRISDKDIKNYLQSNLTYTLHKPARKKMIHPKVRALGIDNVWMMDLAEFGNIQKYNDGVRYLLFVIDVFSKYLFIRTLKSKRGEEVSEQFADIIIKSGRRPAIVASDLGSEFYCKPMKEIMDQLAINHISTGSQVKSSVVERSVRTIKSRLYKYFTHANTYRYLDIIQQLVHNYNRTRHTTTNYKPIEVNQSNEEDIYNNVFREGRVAPNRVDDIKKGDYVRLAIIKGIYKKGYEVSYTPEVYVVDSVLIKPKNIRMYTLHNMEDESIKGAFLREEIQKVVFDPQATYPVEKILSTHGKGRNKTYKVKWLHWPDQFNSFVNAAYIKKINNSNG